MRFATIDQKFEVVLESHWFLYRFLIHDGVITENVCWYIYELDSSCSGNAFPRTPTTLRLATARDWGSRLNVYLALITKPLNWADNSTVNWDTISTDCGVVSVVSDVLAVLIFLNLDSSKSKKRWQICMQMAKKNNSWPSIAWHKN